MFYDLNVPWTTNSLDLQRTISFLSELGYSTLALSHTLSGKLPPTIVSPIPSPLPFSTPKNLRLLQRCTLILSDPSQNHRLAALTNAYDILAIRPTTEKALMQACQTLDCDLISIDLTVRHPFYLKHKTLHAALQRGIKFEICYAPGIVASDSMARRNLISNATQLIRATRGRGIVISSEASKAVACRGPWDVINLTTVWGLGQEKGREAVDREARAVVVQAEMKRRSFRGVIDVVYGGERMEPKADKEPPTTAKQGHNGKRKAEEISRDKEEVKKVEAPVSKREQKRRAKKARFEALKGSEGAAPEVVAAEVTASETTVP